MGPLVGCLALCHFDDSALVAQQAADSLIHLCRFAACCQVLAELLYKPLDDFSTALQERWSIAWIVVVLWVFRLLSHQASHGATARQPPQSSEMPPRRCGWPGESSRGRETRAFPAMGPLVGCLALCHFDDSALVAQQAADSLIHLCRFAACCQDQQLTCGGPCGAFITTLQGVLNHLLTHKSHLPLRKKPSLWAWRGVTWDPRAAQVLAELLYKPLDDFSTALQERWSIAWIVVVLWVFRLLSHQASHGATARQPPQSSEMPPRRCGWPGNEGIPRDEPVGGAAQVLAELLYKPLDDFSTALQERWSIAWIVVVLWVFRLLSHQASHGATARQPPQSSEMPPRRCGWPGNEGIPRDGPVGGAAQVLAELLYKPLDDFSTALQERWSIAWIVVVLWLFRLLSHQASHGATARQPPQSSEMPPRRCGWPGNEGIPRDGPVGGAAQVLAELLYKPLDDFSTALQERWSIAWIVVVLWLFRLLSHQASHGATARQPPQSSEMPPRRCGWPGNEGIPRDGPVGGAAQVLAELLYKPLDDFSTALQERWSIAWIVVVLWVFRLLSHQASHGATARQPPQSSEMPPRRCGWPERPFAGFQAPFGVLVFTFRALKGWGKAFLFGDPGEWLPLRIGGAGLDRPVSWETRAFPAMGPLVGCLALCHFDDSALVAQQAADSLIHLCRFAACCQEPPASEEEAFALGLAAAQVLAELLYKPLDDFSTALQERWSIAWIVVVLWVFRLLSHQASHGATARQPPQSSEMPPRRCGWPGESSRGRETRAFPAMGPLVGCLALCHFDDSALVAQQAADSLIHLCRFAACCQGPPASEEEAFALGLAAAQVLAELLYKPLDDFSTALQERWSIAWIVVVLWVFRLLSHQASHGATARQPPQSSEMPPRRCGWPGNEGIPRDGPVGGAAQVLAELLYKPLDDFSTALQERWSIAWIVVVLWLFRLLSHQASHGATARQPPQSSEMPPRRCGWPGNEGIPRDGPVGGAAQVLAELLYKPLDDFSTALQERWSIAWIVVVLWVFRLLSHQASHGATARQPPQSSEMPPRRCGWPERPFAGFQAPFGVLVFTFRALKGWGKAFLFGDPGEWLPLRIGGAGLDRPVSWETRAFPAMGPLVGCLALCHFDDSALVAQQAADSLIHLCRFAACCQEPPASEEEAFALGLAAAQVLAELLYKPLDDFSTALQERWSIAWIVVVLWVFRLLSHQASHGATARQPPQSSEMPPRRCGWPGESSRGRETRAFPAMGPLVGCLALCHFDDSALVAQQAADSLIHLCRFAACCQGPPASEEEAFALGLAAAQVLAELLYKPLDDFSTALQERWSIAWIVVVLWVFRLLSHQASHGATARQPPQSSEMPPRRCGWPGNEGIPRDGPVGGAAQVLAELLYKPLDDFSTALQERWSIAWIVVVLWVFRLLSHQASHGATARQPPQSSEMPPRRCGWPGKRKTIYVARSGPVERRGMGLIKSVGIQATESLGASEKESEDTGESEEAAPKATLEPPTVDDTVVHTNLLEIGMRRLKRDLEVRCLNEAIAAQAAEESGDEEEDSEEAEDERE
ncbi:UNVERIFIED_CONTAM: hypothetical protein K2H54_004376 [Gekko kuhli]